MNLNEISTEDLFDEIKQRASSFVMAYEMPENGDDARIVFEWSKGDYYKSLGLAKGMLIDIESVLHHECAKYHMEGENDE